MSTRNLGRTLVIIAIAGTILSLAWWATYYNGVVRALGPKPALAHPMRCLLWTADICVQPAAAAKVQNIPAYSPLVLWALLLVLLAGLLVIYRSPAPGSYPVTPPGEPKLLIPQLEPFYAWTRDLAWAIVRVATGGTVMAIGIDKVLHRDINVFATGSMARRGLEPAMPLAYFLYFLELVGGLMIVLGLFTRFFGAVFAIEFFIITFLAQFSTGFPARPRLGHLSDVGPPVLRHCAARRGAVFARPLTWPRAVANATGRR